MWDLVFSDFRHNAQDIVAIIICVAAIVWGGGPERVLAATWLLIFEFLSQLQDWVFGQGVQLSGVDWFVASQDTVVGLIFIGVALFANRNYTILIAAMQVMAITAHLARGVADFISPVAYAVMFIVPGWVQLLLLGLGVIRHVQRRRAHGQYRDWRVSKPSLGNLGNPIASNAGSAWPESQQEAPRPSWRDELK